MMIMHWSFSFCLVFLIMSVKRVAYKSIEGIEAWLSRFGWGISPVKNDDSILRCWLNSCKAWVRARVLYMCSLAKDRYLSRHHHYSCCTGGSQRDTYGWRASRSSAVGINTGTGLFSTPLFRWLYSSTSNRRLFFICNNILPAARDCWSF